MGEPGIALKEALEKARVLFYKVGESFKIKAKGYYVEFFIKQG